MTAPFLSVVIPIYNGGAYLAAALESVARQVDRVTEIVAIDGGSTDGSLELVRSYESRMAVRLLVRPELSNWMTKTNFGFQEARGEFVTMLHQDDYWLPNRLTRIAQALGEHPSMDLLLHDVQFVDAAGDPLGVMRYPLSPLPALMAPPALIKPLLVQNFISVPTPVIRRSAALAVGGIDTALWYTGDWDFYLKLAGRCRVGYIPAPLAAFRVHGASMTMTGARRLDDFRQQMLAVLERHLGELASSTFQRSDIDICRLSIEMNVALAGISAGNFHGLPRAFASLISVGPTGIARYLRFSRLVERLRARTSSRLLWAMLARRAS